MLIGFLALVLLSTPTQAVAAPAAATPTPPNCSAAAEYHQLDFWIGDWDTFETDTPGGPSEARTHVDPIAQGCAIHELYEQIDGLIGDSILSYDPARKQWQQTWVTNRGSIMVIVGNFKDGALDLEGEMHFKDGRSVMQRITWKAQDKGVRESSVVSKDSGKTWTPTFDVLFLKHKDRVLVPQVAPSASTKRLITQQPETMARVVLDVPLHRVDQRSVITQPRPVVPCSAR